MKNEVGAYYHILLSKLLTELLNCQNFSIKRFSNKRKASSSQAVTTTDRDKEKVKTINLYVQHFLSCICVIDEINYKRSYWGEDEGAFIRRVCVSETPPHPILPPPRNGEECD